MEDRKGRAVPPAGRGLKRKQDRQLMLLCGLMVALLPALLNNGWVAVAGCVTTVAATLLAVRTHSG